MKWVKFKTSYDDFCEDFNKGCECGFLVKLDLPYKEVDIQNLWSLDYNGYLNVSGECYDISGLCNCHVGYGIKLTYNKQTEKLTSNVNYEQTLIFSNKNQTF